MTQGRVNADAPGGGQTSGHGQVAVVTGASEGIGLAVARRLAGDGYRVAMVARPSAKLDAAAAEVGPAAFPAGCDVTRPADTNERWPRWCGTAGGSTRSLTARAPPERVRLTHSPTMNGLRRSR